MRTATGAEVDFVLEMTDGRLAGIEVKASATVRGEDFKHLATMRDRIGKERFVRGVVLYTGAERLPFGEQLEAWPLSTLWTDTGARSQRESNPSNPTTSGRQADNPRVTTRSVA